ASWRHEFAMISYCWPCGGFGSRLMRELHHPLRRNGQLVVNTNTVDPDALRAVAIDACMPTRSLNATSRRYGTTWPRIGVREESSGCPSCTSGAMLVLHGSTLIRDTVRTWVGWSK